MSAPTWQSAALRQPIPPPPPFPPGDPRLGPPQSGYPAPGWMRAQPQPWVQLHPGPGPSRARSTSVALMAGIGAVAVALVVAVLSYGTTPTVEPSTQPAVVVPADTRPLAPAPTSGINLGTSPSLAIALPQIEAFVEKARGHRFLQPVTVTPLADRAFLTQLHKGDSEADGAAVKGQEATYEALHLLPLHTDLAATLAAQTDQGVGGFYDPASKQLFVRSAALDPLAQVIVAHELTHALDDQYFGLQGLLTEAQNGDQEMAVRSLAEGDARSVEDRFRAAMVPSQRALAASEEKSEFGTGSADSTPLFLEISSEFPYDVGEQFVDVLRSTGGAAAVDAAFRAPPSSTLQIMDPHGSYLHRRDPIVFGTSVGPPQGAAGKVVDQDQLGAFGLASLLSERTPSRLLDQQAVAYWDGDRYTTTRDGGQVCTRDTIETVNAAGRKALEAALRTWTRTHPGRR